MGGISAPGTRRQVGDVAAGRAGGAAPWFVGSSWKGKGAVSIWRTVTRTLMGHKWGAPTLLLPTGKSGGVG